MEWAVRVAAFYNKACADNRISPVHISLYFALLHEACTTGVDLLLPVRDYLMQRSKVCSTVTYHRCLRELHVYGYIDYRPSKAAGRSRVEMIELRP
jgi:hypothetical protein